LCEQRNSQKKTSTGSEDGKGSGTAASAGTGIVSGSDVGAFPTEDQQIVDDSVVIVTFKEKYVACGFFYDWLGITFSNNMLCVAELHLGVKANA